MSKLSSKHQVTIAVRILREAGLTAGDDVVIRANGLGPDRDRASNRPRPPVRREPASRHLPPGLPRRAARRVARIALDADVVIRFLDPSDAQHDQAVELIGAHLATGDDVLIAATVYAEGSCVRCNTEPTPRSMSSLPRSTRTWSTSIALSLATPRSSEPDTPRCVFPTPSRSRPRSSPTRSSSHSIEACSGSRTANVSTRHPHTRLAREGSVRTAGATGRSQAAP
jgi:hypothetical protein